MDLSVIWRLQDLMSAPVQKVIRTVATAQRSLEKANAGMSAGFRRTTGSVNELRNKIEGLKAYRDGLRVGVDTSAITRANTELQALHRQLEKVEKINARRDGSGGINKGMIAGVMSRYLPYLSATAAIAGVSGVAKMGMDREMDLSRFEQFIPNNIQAHQTFNDLNKWGNDTIYKNNDVLNVGARVAEQFGANKVMSQMKMYGDLGDGFAMQGIARTMGQIKGVGRLQGDELNELANHGILGLQTQIAKMKGISIATFNKMKEAGKISFEDVQKAMEAMTSKGGAYYGYLDRVSNNTFGKLQKLIGTVSEKLTKFSFENLPRLNMVLDWANKFIDNWGPIGNAISNLTMAFNPLWEAIHKILEVFGVIPQSGDGVIETVNWIVIVMNKLAVIIEFVGKVVNNLVTGIRALPFGDVIIQGLAFAGVLSKISIAGNLMNLGKSFAGVLPWMKKIADIPWSRAMLGMNGLRSVWMALNAAFVATPIGAIIVGIIALAAALTYAWENSAKFREVVIRSWVAIQAVFEKIKPYLIGLWDIIKWLGKAYWEYWKFLANIYLSIAKAIWASILWVKNKTMEIWNSLSDGTKSVFKTIGEVILTSIRVAIGVATLGLSEFIIWALGKLGKVAEVANKGYNSKTATDAVVGNMNDRFMDKINKSKEHLKAIQEIQKLKHEQALAEKAAAWAKAHPTKSSPSGTVGAGTDKASTVSDTVEGTRSKNIVINIDKLIGTTNIYADKQNVGRSVQDEVIEALIRILSSGQPLAFE